MKKNAIVIASILFLASSARAQADDYRRSTPPNRSIASQYDPATADPRTSVDSFHADSSVRGGSNEARGVARLGNELEPLLVHPINPLVQADSSIRGGSAEARDPGSRNTISLISGIDTDRVKADSSKRGGSNQARHLNGNFQSEADFQTSANVESAYCDESLPVYQESDRADFDMPLQKLDDPSSSAGEGSWSAEKGNGPLADSNWNPGDDLLRDGIGAESDFRQPFEYNKDYSVGGPARSERGSSSSSELQSQDDVDLSFESPDLNVSSRLEQNISGEYHLGDPAESEFGQTDAVGGPGSTETGAGQSNGSLLSQKVKGTLMRESTGAIGMTSREVARNIQVTSHGGLVTLKGTVPSREDRQMIEIRAREVDGVTRVDNQLTVAPAADSGLRDFDFKAGRNLEDRTDQLQDAWRD